MAQTKNRCFGCEHYDGYYKMRVICAEKVKTTIDKGCERFAPDNSARCLDCYYNTGGAKVDDFQCKKYGYIARERTRCEGFAERWEKPSGIGKKMLVALMIVIAVLWIML